ncbi:MAG: cell division protein FtsK [Ruminococcus sp.]|nr:cell division protein FtsK [Ruminococcus sp.]
MESNKLLIGVQFWDGKGIDAVIELIVLRDSTLKQLFDGIKYGLAKKPKDSVYGQCRQLFDRCVSAVDKNGVYRKITLTSHNESLGMEMDSRNRVILCESDLQEKLEDIGFISSTRLVFDYTEQYQSFSIDTSMIIDAFSPEKGQSDIVFPEYNISTRQLYKFDTEPVEIVPPAEPPQKQSQSLLTTLLPSLLMISSMVLIRGLMSSGNSGMSMIALSATMGGVTLLTAVMNWFMQRRSHKKKVREWREQYEAYIAKTIDEINNRKLADAQKLHQLYPDVNDIVSGRNPERSAKSVCGHIFSRSCNDEDFLSVRLGVSDNIENKFEIKGNSKDVVFSAANFMWLDDTIKISIPEDKNYRTTQDKQLYLTNLPKFISGKYKYMSEAPLVYSLKNCGALGIVSPEPESADYLIERLIFDLCFYHSPDDLQFVILFEPAKNWSEMDRRITPYKFLPHFRELLDKRAQFAFDAESAASIFSSCFDIMANRVKENNASQGAVLPHIVFIVYEEYGLKEHAFAQFLPEVPEAGKPFVNTAGITFIFQKRYKEHLPSYCTDVITMPDDCSGVLVPREDENKNKAFRYIEYNEYAGNHDPDVDEWVRETYGSYKILSALCYSKIAQNGKVPSNVSLFELFDIKGGNIDIGALWGEKDGKRVYDIVGSLGVPIGKTDTGKTYLDLHEKGDGPHMLVAGTTGSGKSETIITYLLGLCLQYRPDEVNLMLVDMKGGGFIKRIGTLPHVVGSVTDVDGDENGTGAAYMLKRFLDALASEIRRRKILFNSMHVDNINDYVKVCRNIESHIDSINNSFPKDENGNPKEQLSEKEVAAIRKQAKDDVLTHLILVVDEFTELKRFSSENDDIDFIKEIATIARVGRSLGLHIILISQNIEGAITDEIRVNSRARLCLKVATKQASKEMINTDLAASPTMPGNGRGYLLVGTGTRFEYFQSGYSGAYVEDNVEAPVEIVEASKNGANSVFYRSSKDNTEAKKRLKELEDQGRLKRQLNAVVEAVIEQYENNRDKYSTPHIVFQPPLPDKIYINDGKIMKYHDGKYELMKEV